MTIPRERNQSIRSTHAFLRDLIDPKETPRVPRDIRLRALRCLRHYPNPYEMDRFENDSEDVFYRKAWHDE